LIKLIFFGTGTSQGIPVIGSKHEVCFSKDIKDKRLRSSALIEVKGKSILIDCGPDFRQQMLLNSKSNLDAILLTHEHNDHVLGLDDVRPINFQKQKDIPLYGLRRTLHEVKLRFPYAFVSEKYPGTPGFELNNIDENPFFIDEIEILPINILHGILPIIGYRIENLAYITDASFVEEIEFEKLKNLEVLVINSLRKESKHPSHFILEESLDFINKVKPNKAYITHISHLMGFHEEVQKTLPKNVFLAYDGLEIDLT